jgi:hypothetical protein
VYRSNGTIPNVTGTQQMNSFFNLFDEFLFNLNRKNTVSYIFMDSNIDLLNIQSEEATNLLNSTFTHGYLQNIMKCTRMQNNSKTLIDQIFSSSKSNSIYSGTVISDLSDHFSPSSDPTQHVLKVKRNPSMFANFLLQTSITSKLRLAALIGRLFLIQPM